VISPRALDSYIEPTEKAYSRLFESKLNRDVIFHEELRLTQLRLASKTVTLFGIEFKGDEDEEFR
jgi:hypothetical protein